MSSIWIEMLFSSNRTFTLKKTENIKNHALLIQSTLWLKLSLQVFDDVLWYSYHTFYILYIFWLWFSLEVFTFTSKNMFGANAQHSSQLLPSLWEPFTKLVNLYLPCIQKYLKILSLNKFIFLIFWVSFSKNVSLKYHVNVHLLKQWSIYQNNT